MTFTSLNPIKIGRAPDFVMRLGKMDIYHKANLYFFSQERQLQYPGTILITLRLPDALEKEKRLEICEPFRLVNTTGQLKNHLSYRPKVLTTWPEDHSKGGLHGL